jgi:hypothetical protein
MSVPRKRTQDMQRMSYVRSNQRPGMNCHKEAKVTGPSSHTRLEIVPVPARMESLNDSHCVLISQKGILVLGNY